jgi:putative proteasome-type protease
MNFEDAVKLLLVSFDSTLKANMSVGLPLDLLVIVKDQFVATHEHRVTADDAYFDAISSGWGNALRSAFYSLPPYQFSDDA